MSDKSKEYLMLRTEILQTISIIHNVRQMMYTSVGVLLAFGFTQKDALLFLLPVVVIMPSYLISLNLIRGMYEIGAYLNIFLEGDEFNWERRKFAVKKMNDKEHHHLSFV